MTRSGRWLGRAIVALLPRPWLWGTAIVQVARLAPARWWAHWPPLPVPDGDYLRFRLQTQYGDPEHQPEPRDVVAYLKWCRSYPRSNG